MKIGLKAYEGAEWQQISYQQTPTSSIFGAIMWKGRLVTTHESGDINVWNLDTNSIVKTIKTTSVLAQLCLAQGFMFGVAALGGFEWNIVKIDMDAGTVTPFKFEDPQAFISLTTDGNNLWAQSNRGPYWQIDPGTFTETNIFPTKVSNPDLIEYSNEILIVGSNDQGTLSLFNSNNGERIGTLEGGYASSGITVLPGGLIANNSIYESYPVLQIWDLTSLSKLQEKRFNTTDSTPTSIVRRGNDYIVAAYDGISVYGVTHLDYKGMLYEQQIGSGETNGIILNQPDGGFIAALTSGWVRYQRTASSNPVTHEDVTCNQTFLDQLKMIVAIFKPQ